MTKLNSSRSRRTSFNNERNYRSFPERILNLFISLQKQRVRKLLRFKEHNSQCRRKNLSIVILSTGWQFTRRTWLFRNSRSIRCGSWCTHTKIITKSCQRILIRSRSRSSSRGSSSKRCPKWISSSNRSRSRRNQRSTKERIEITSSRGRRRRSNWGSSRCTKRIRSRYGRGSRYTKRIHRRHTSCRWRRRYHRRRRSNTKRIHRHRRSRSRNRRRRRRRHIKRIRSRSRRRW
mmetsp:Transcript_14312/g.18718  ORF Transcript_14312/g.18718 Transcript_14312/m.18718 type:complete len:233 (-) Transcript_14312:682-1380(-)